MRSLMRFFARCVLYGTGAVAVLVFSAFLLLQTDKGRNRAKAFLESGVSNASGLRLSIGKISGDFLFSVILEDVKLYHKNNRLVEARKISATYFAPLLLKQTLFINEIRVQRGVLNLERGPHGEWNFAGSGIDRKPSESKRGILSGFRIIVRRAALTDADIRVVERGAHETVTRRFENTGLVAGFSLRSGTVVSADIYETRFRLDKPKFTLKNLSGEIGYDLHKNRLRLHRIRLRSAVSDLSVEGVADFSGVVPTIDVTTEIKRLSISEIGRLASVETLRKGDLSGRVSVKGSLDKFSHRLNLQLGGATIRTEGTVTRAGGKNLDLDLNGAIRNLNLDILSSIGLPVLAGVVNAEFKANGTDLMKPERRGVLELEVRDSRLDRYAVNQGKLRVMIDRGRLHVAHLDLKTPMGAAVVEGSLAGFFDAEKEKTIQVKTRISHLDLVQMTNLKDLSGNMNLALRIEAALPPHATDMASLSGNMTGEIESSTLFGVALKKGDLDVVWSDGRLDLRRLSLDTDSGRIALTGNAVPRRKTAAATLDLKAADLKKIGRIAARLHPSLHPMQPWSGTIAASGRVSGWWDRPSFDGAIHARDVRVNQVSAKTLAATGQWRGLPASFNSGGQIEVKDLTFNRIRLSTLKTAATLSPDSIGVTLDAIHQNGEKLKLRGRIDHWRDARKQITVDRLLMIPKASSKAVKYGSRLSNQGPIRILISPRSVDIRSFKVVFDQAVLSLEGELNAEKEASLALSLRRLELDRFSWLMPAKDRVHGTLSADIHVSGTGKRPTLKAAVRVRNGAGYDVYFSELKVRLSYNRSKLVATAALELSDGEKIEVNGKADIGWTLLPFRLNLPGRNLDISVNAKALRLSRLPIRKIPNFKYDGDLDVTARLTGDPASPMLNGAVTLKNGSVQLKGHRLPFSRFAVHLNYGKTNAVGKIELERNGNPVLTATGRAAVQFSLWPFACIPLDKEMDGVLRIQNIDLKEWSFHQVAPFDYGGLLDLSATIAGRPVSPVFSADLFVNNGHFAMDSGSSLDVPFSKLSAKLRYQKSRATADITLHRDTEQLLAINGALDVSLAFMPFQFTPGVNLDASLMTRGLRLSALPLPEISGVDMDGKIDATVRVQGDWKAPRITGDLGVTEGSVSVKRPLLTYEKVSAKVRWIPGKIVIDSLSVAGDKAGRLRLSGDIMLSGVVPTRFNVRLTGEDLFIPFPPAVRARVQPDILLSGSLDTPVLTGTVVVHESRLNLDRFIEEGPAEIQVKGRETDERGRIELVDTASQSQGLALFEPLSADLNVVIPKNAWLKGQGLDAEIGGRINIKKDPSQPFILLGSLGTIRGNYNFQGKLFRFRRGKVDFLGLAEPNPNLDFEAVSKIRSVDIIIRIGGSARNIRLALDSDPQMEQTDIVSYIMFGKPADALNDRDSVNVEKAALGLTGQVAAAELKNILGDDFFLDMITYEPGATEESRGAVAVGKYVTPDVFVKYRQGLSADQPYELEASYEVNKNFRIQTNVGNEKTTGVDVFFGFDF